MLEFAIALTFTLSGAPALVAEASTVDDWWSVQRHVIAGLEERDVGQWSRELAQQPMPKDVAGLIERLQVNARAGHDLALEEVLARLAELSPEFQRSELRPLPQFFVERGDLVHARLTFEQLPHVPTSSAGVLLRTWVRESPPEEVDAWVRERWTGDRAWTHVWLEFRRRLGTASEVIELLEQELRAAPSDMESFQRYVDAVGRAGPPDVELDWLTEVARPEGALALHRAGEALARRWPSAARPFLERSLPIRPTEAEEGEIARRMSIPISALPGSPTAASLLRAWTLRCLMQVEERLGNGARAQELLEELAELAPDGLPAGSLKEAGSIQGLSGARVIEGRVRAAEEERGEDASYWLERAAYYEGRAEREEERLALTEARRLAAEEGEFMQGRARNRWARFLAATEDRGSVLAFLLSELREAVPGSEAAAGIVRTLMHHKSDRCSQPDPALDVFWAHLGALEEWGHGERMLLMAMGHKLDRGRRSDGRDLAEGDDGLGAFWTRAEGLAKAGNPSRAAVLGGVMTSRDEDLRAQPLLASALARMPEGREAKAVAAELHRALLTTGDWRGAEEVEPQTRGYLTPVEVGERRAGLARCAAEAGELDEALRIWKGRVNLDRGALVGLDELAELGLREELARFYEGLLEREPECVPAGRALERLR